MSCAEGDLVAIQETKPFSKNTTFIVREIIKKADRGPGNVIFDSNPKNLVEELIEMILKEKEELREVIGKIGGNNNPQAKIVTTLFVGIVLIIFVTGIILKQLSPTTTLLLLILILSFKIIWMQQQTQKSMHFQFWILNSIEIRINELDKKQKKLEKMIEELEKKKE